MNRKISLLAAAMIFAVMTSVRAAELRSTVGTVEVKKAGAATWTQGRPKTAVKDGDVVRTGVGSETEIKLDGGHKMTLREKTTLRVDSGQAPQTKLELLGGRVRTFVSKLKRQNKFEIKTPVAVASIRGTVFDLEVTEDNKSRLSVLEGIVNYRDIAGLGKEVQVLQGQSVVIEPGSGAQPPEPLPQDMKQGLVPDKASQDMAFSLKAEVTREAGMSAFKEFFQADAAAEMKVAQYQESKTLIDAFGNRVRLEEYVIRPAANPNQFSFVALNTREDRFDFTRFDLFAKNPLPADLNSTSLSSLFGTDGHVTMSNWAEKTQRLSSSDKGDYYREWQDGGDPLFMTNPDNGRQTTAVVFDHWYTEVRSQNDAPVLLSHWVPTAAYLGGDPRATTAQKAELSTLADLAQDIPTGYQDFGTPTLGDVRPIDSAGFTNARRLEALTDATVAASYAASEGFARTSVALFDGGSAATLTGPQILNATTISRRSVYDRPNDPDVTLLVDQYYISDEGDRLGFEQAALLGSRLEGINFQNVFTSSLTGDRKIDVVISPSIFKKLGLLDN